MKTTELREKIGSLEKEQLQTLFVEMYKLIPKSIKDGKDIDALIDNPAQFKTQKKTTKTAAATVDFQELKHQIEQFMKHAYAQYYIAPNRVIPKKDRSHWRLIAKRFIDQILMETSNPDHQQDCADLFERLYVLFCYASNHYTFVSEEPFYTLKITQEAFLKQVILLKQQVEPPKQWIQTTLQLILEHGVDRQTLTSTLLETLVEHLPHAPLKEQAIAICKQLLAEQQTKLTESPPKQNFFSSQSTSKYTVEGNINTLVDMIFILQSMLGEKEQAIQYFEQHTIQSSPEIKLYTLLRSIKGYQQIEDWLNTYERAVATGVKPRQQLQKEYMYIKKHSKFSWVIW